MPKAKSMTASNTGMEIPRPVSDLPAPKKRGTVLKESEGTSRVVSSGPIVTDTGTISKVSESESALG